MCRLYRIGRCRADAGLGELLNWPWAMAVMRLASLNGTILAASRYSACGSTPHPTTAKRRRFTFAPICWLVSGGVLRVPEPFQTLLDPC